MREHEEWRGVEGKGCKDVMILCEGKKNLCTGKRCLDGGRGRKRLPTLFIGEVVGQTVGPSRLANFFLSAGGARQKRCARFGFA